MRSSEEIKSEIEARFGFFPPFFEPALSSPRVLENLWQQTLLAYVDNPLPDLFKEKLAALLARFCSVPYCLVCHSSALRPLGLSPKEVLEILSREAMDMDEIEENVRFLDKKPLESWPEPGSLLEECILSCCIGIFLHQNEERAHEKLRRILDPERYSLLISFVAYNRTCLSWAEAHPELSYEADERVKRHLGALLAEEPALADFFENFRTIVKEQAERRAAWLSRDSQRFAERERQALQRLQVIQERFDRVSETLGVGLLSSDLTPESVFVNEKFKEQFFLEPDSRGLVSTLVERVHPDDREHAWKECENAIRTGGVCRIEFKTIDPGDSSRTKRVQLVGWASYDPKSRPLRFEAITFSE